MCEQSFLLVHGIENRRPPEHWQSWLALQLRARGAQVLYPQFPDPDTPCYDAWEQTLNANLAQLSGSERVVICHSLGCLLWLRAGARLNQQVDRVLLVSIPAGPLVPEDGAEFRLAEIPTIDANIRIACADNDPFDPERATHAYARAQLDVIAGAGHIIPDSGYGPWPAALAWCVDPTRRLRAN